MNHEATDSEILAVWDALQREWADARARIDRDGLVVADEKGRPVPHPALAIERGASAEMSRWVAAVKRARAALLTGGPRPPV